MEYLNIMNKHHTQATVHQNQRTYFLFNCTWNIYYSLSYKAWLTNLKEFKLSTECFLTTAELRQTFQDTENYPWMKLKKKTQVENYKMFQIK